MIKDFFISFKENIKQKTANPFFGTLIIVWIFHNWKLVFSIFYFDDSFNYEKKIAFISNYFEQETFVANLSKCVGISFVMIVASYTLINVSRFIINLFEKRVTPWIYELTDTKSVVLKSDYELLKNENRRLEKKIEEERDLRIKTQKENEELEKKATDKMFKSALSPSLSPKETSPINDEKTTILLKKLKDRGLLDAFEEISGHILNNQPQAKSDQTIIKLTQLGLIRQEASRGNLYAYGFTELGKKVHEAMIYDNEY